MRVKSLSVKTHSNLQIHILSKILKLRSIRMKLKERILFFNYMSPNSPTSEKDNSFHACHHSKHDGGGVSEMRSQTTVCTQPKLFSQVFVSKSLIRIT